jgi:hypothetical protein
MCQLASSQCALMGGCTEMLMALYFDIFIRNLKMSGRCRVCLLFEFALVLF